MPDIELLTSMDRALVERGLIATSHAGELCPVHAMIQEFRSSTGTNFSERDLQRGARRLRRWLGAMRASGVDEGRLASYLRCGLGHLCFAITEFTYETARADEITELALRSFLGRGYDRATLAAPRQSGKRRPSKAKGTIRKRRPRKGITRFS